MSDSDTENVHDKDRTLPTTASSGDPTDPPPSPVPVLSKVSYAFERTDTKNILSTLTLTFIPKDGLKSTDQQVKSFGLNLFQYYKPPLDILYEQIIEGERQPYVNDGPWNFCFGYKYKGKSCDLTEAHTQQLAKALFNLPELPDYPSRRPLHSVATTLSSQHGLHGEHYRMPHVSINLALHPLLNRCFLDYTRNMPQLEYSTAATQSLDDLQLLLETQSEPTIEHFFSMLPKRNVPTKNESTEQQCDDNEIPF